VTVDDAPTAATAQHASDANDDALRRLNAAEADKNAAEARLNAAEADKNDAKRRLDAATAHLNKLLSENTAPDAIKRAEDAVMYQRGEVVATRKSYDKAVQLYHTLVNIVGANTVARPRVVPWPAVLSADARAAIARDIREWPEGQNATFDVTGIGAAIDNDHWNDKLFVRAAIDNDQWHDKLFVRAEGVAVLKEWESNTPRIIVHGTSGIGMSALVQFAALRLLLRGEPVHLHVHGVEKLLTPKGDGFTCEIVSLHAWRSDLPDTRELIVLFDSREGFETKVGNATNFKRVLIVHSPSAAINNSKKSDGTIMRYFANPTEVELIAIAALNGIVDAAEVRRRIGLFGPSIRNVCDANGHRLVDAGISDLVSVGIEGLKTLRTQTREVHRITLVVPAPRDLTMLVFASDYIRDQVASRLSMTHKTDLLALANTVDIHGSLRGQIFENRMLDALGRVGTVTLKSVDGARPKVLAIAGAGVALNLNNKVYSLPDGDRVVAGTLYRPPHSNNESWDAIFVESSTTAYLLQMTVASEHPVKRNGIAAGEKFLFDNGFDKKGKVHIVFLVPPLVFRDFKVPQKMLDSRKQECADVTSARWPQAKWCVDKVDGVAFWPAA
jgi:hypothetical protein